MAGSNYVEQIVDGQPQGYLEITGTEYEMQVLDAELKARQYAQLKATGGLVIPQSTENFETITKETK